MIEIMTEWSPHKFAKIGQSSSKINEKFKSVSQIRWYGATSRHCPFLKAGPRFMQSLRPPKLNRFLHPCGTFSQLSWKRPEMENLTLP